MTIVIILALVAIVVLVAEQGAAVASSGACACLPGPCTDCLGANVQDSSLYSSQIQAFALAIAAAENSNAKYNNPGDLKVYGWTGPTFGAGISDLSGEPAGTGMNYLCQELQLIVNGQSAYYTLSMSIGQMATVWTGACNAASWAAKVAETLGPEATVNDPLSEWLS
jgi:hypothetical protein